mmetsp:Transcript_2937/g.8057  ORF Transcript_2937/g.8057 Transcript_2937/m.8057 type:complete len:179 (+) Transcript_2937:34-570(+)
MMSPLNFVFCALTVVIPTSLVDGFPFPTKQPDISSPPVTVEKSYQQTAVGNVDDNFTDGSRRSSFLHIMSTVIGGTAVLSSPMPTYAAVDCMKDCLQNCLIIAPKDKEYCTDSCRAYCAQDDRTDGLSGSVSAANGEVGILGGSFGQGTVPKGDDKPPSVTLPGLDFSSPSGKKLIGY